MEGGRQIEGKYSSHCQRKEEEEEEEEDGRAFGSFPFGSFHSR